MMKSKMVPTVVILAALAALPPAVRSAAADAETNRLETRLRALEAHNQELARELARRAAEVERYRSQLELLAAELEGLKGNHQPLPAAVPVRESLWHRRGTLHSRPVVRLVRQQVVVTGEVANSGQAAVEGILTIELLRDGRPVDAARYRVGIAARRRLSYSHRFALGGWAAGSYTARAWVSPPGP